MAPDSLKKNRRIFLALPLAESFQAEILSALKQLENKKGVKWVRPEHVHVTLHFFGEASPEEIQTIESITAAVVPGFAPFKIKTGGLGFFPALRSPRIIWLGLEGDTGPLAELWRILESKFAAAGFSVESRPFQPHATLGRIKKNMSLRGGEADEAISDLRLPRPFGARNDDKYAASFKVVDRIVLFESQLSPQGPHYEILKTFFLSGKPAA